MQPSHPSYFVVMVKMRDGKLKSAFSEVQTSRVAIVRWVAMGNLSDIAFIHHIHDGKVDDIGTEIFRDVAAYLNGHKGGTGA